MRVTVDDIPSDLDKAPKDGRSATIHPMEDVIELGHKKGTSMWWNFPDSVGFELHLAGGR